MPELHMVTKMIQVASSSACKGCGLDCTKPDTASPYALLIHVVTHIHAYNSTRL